MGRVAELGSLNNADGASEQGDEKEMARIMRIATRASRSRRFAGCLMPRQSNGHLPFTERSKSPVAIAVAQTIPESVAGS